MYGYWWGLWKAGFDLALDLGDTATRLNQLYLDLFWPQSEQLGLRRLPPAADSQFAPLPTRESPEHQVQTAFSHYLAEQGHPGEIEINRVAVVKDYALLDWWTGEQGSGGAAALVYQDQGWRVLRVSNGKLTLKTLLEARIPRAIATQLLDRVFPYWRN
jgi:hypothetical protein